MTVLGCMSSLLIIIIRFSWRFLPGLVFCRLMPSCCSCNGRNAVCKRCVCTQAGTPCSSCLPLKMKCCMNVLTTRQDSQVDTSRRGVLFNKNFDDTDASDVGSLSAHVSLPSNDDCRYDVCDVLAPASRPSSIVESASADAGLCTSQPSMSSSID